MGARAPGEGSQVTDKFLRTARPNVPMVDGHAGPDHCRGSSLGGRRSVRVAEVETMILREARTNHELGVNVLQDAVCLRDDPRTLMFRPRGMVHSLFDHRARV